MHVGLHRGKRSSIVTNNIFKKSNQKKEATMKYLLLASMLLFLPETGAQPANGRTLLAGTNIFERNPIIEPRVVGGQLARDDDYEFFCHALDRQLCGGTLIHPNVILTAASCQTAFGKEAIVGSADLFGRDGAERIAVDLLHPHPAYMPGFKDNDIMLVRLVSPSSQPLATLETEMTLPVDDQDVTVIGLGRTSAQGNIALQLRDVKMQAVSLETCRAMVSDSLIADSQVCAGGGSGGPDSCGGDVGGPLLDSDTLVQYGIVSVNPGCGITTTPGLYTRVSFYADWIQDFICNESGMPPDDCPDPTEPAEEPTSTPPSTPVPGAPTVAPSMTHSPSGSVVEEAGSKGKKSGSSDESTSRDDEKEESSGKKSSKSESGDKESSTSASKSGKKSSTKSTKSKSGKKGSSIVVDSKDEGSTVSPEQNLTTSSSDSLDQVTSKGKKTTTRNYRQKKREKQRQEQRAERARNNRRRYPILD